MVRALLVVLVACKTVTIWSHSARLHLSVPVTTQNYASPTSLASTLPLKSLFEAGLVPAFLSVRVIDVNPDRVPAVRVLFIILDQKLTRSDFNFKLGNAARTQVAHMKKYTRSGDIGLDETETLSRA